ncbi:MAG: homocitrate synthase/isopropylmalate synthase family protein [Peptococcaceae bacterium]
MTVVLTGGPCLIIDRTLTQLAKINKQFEGEEIFRFCRLLQETGVDLIEINSVFLKKLGTVPPGLDFVLRIDSREELVSCGDPESVKFILITRPELLKKLADHKDRIIFEWRGDSKAELSKAVQDLKTPAGRIAILRIQGLSNQMLTDWQVLIKEITGDWQVGIDVCPEDDYSLATALALDLPESSPGVSAISASFNGIGNFAPLEEVIMAAKIIRGDPVLADVSFLQTLKSSFEYLTEKKVLKNKPITGENIFKYESGIHADGIEKNPRTYEPYEPEMVGLKRKLVIGKHSGKNALIAKLKELHIKYDEKEIPRLIDHVKKMSVTLKREISDQELLYLCQSGSWESQR